VTPREAADRAEITDVWNRYFRAMDTWDFASLDAVFTPDAVLRYDALAGIETDYPEMRGRWQQFNPHFSFMQHVGSQLVIDLAGDAATATSSLRAIHVQTTHDGEEAKWVIYGAYRDRFRRTPEGWRIADRHFRQHRSEGRLLPFDRVRRYASPPWLG
jgi:ketosteroid isomerase-like protein